MSHDQDADLIARLRRAEGHLAAVVRMVAEGRDCIVIAQQLTAVARALDTARRDLIRHHLDHHLAEAVGTDAAAIDRVRAEVRELARYL